MLSPPTKYCLGGKFSCLGVATSYQTMQCDCSVPACGCGGGDELAMCNKQVTDFGLLSLGEVVFWLGILRGPQRDFWSLRGTLGGPRGYCTLWALQGLFIPKLIGASKRLAKIEYCNNSHYLDTINQP